MARLEHPRPKGFQHSDLIQLIATIIITIIAIGLALSLMNVRDTIAVFAGGLIGIAAIYIGIMRSITLIKRLSN